MDTDFETAKTGEDRDAAGRFCPGCRPGPGRPAGAANLFTARIREDIAAVYEAKGGRAWMAKVDDREFLKLVKHVVPREAPPAPAQSQAVLGGGSAPTRELLEAIDRMMADPDAQPTLPEPADGEEESEPRRAGGR